MDAEEDQMDLGVLRQQLIHACRTDNIEIVQDLLKQIGDEDKFSDFFNSAKDGTGNYAYHVAARAGSYFVIKEVLNEAAIECDPVNNQGDTPLHSAVRWYAEEQRDPSRWENANLLIDMMLECGSDCHVKNKARQNAMQLIDALMPENTSVKELFQQHSDANLNRGDFFDAGANSASASAAGPQTNGGFLDAKPEEDEDAEFSGSDEEEREEWERQRAARKGR